MNKKNKRIQILSDDENDEIEYQFDQTDNNESEYAQDIFDTEYQNFMHKSLISKGEQMQMSQTCSQELTNNALDLENLITQRIDMLESAEKKSKFNLKINDLKSDK